VYFLTNLYITEQRDIALFMLVNGGIYTFLLWFGYLLVGTIIPLILVYHPVVGKTMQGILTAAFSAVVGGFSLLYVLIIGGQAYPLEIFPNMEIVASSFFDKGVHAYAPSVWEIMLGIGGIGVAFFLTVLGLRVLPFLFLPTALAGVKPEEVD
jgi:molybdopterin-containing oxidoreductase family membrane subunit